jgi:hypothetical protein
MNERNLFSSVLLVPYALALWRWGGVRRPWPLGLAVVGPSAGSFGLTRCLGRPAGIVALWCWRVRPGWRKASVAVAVVTAACALTGSSCHGERLHADGPLQPPSRYFVEVPIPPSSRAAEVRNSGMARPRGSAGAGSVTALEQVWGILPDGQARTRWVGNAVSCSCTTRDWWG